MLLAAVLPPAPADAQTVRFTERADAAGLTGQLVLAPGYPPDLALMIGAVSVGDFNRDGLPDLYAPSGGTTPDRLFINLGGRFEDQAERWGLTGLHRGSTAAVGDVNRDGLDDIFVISFGSPFAPARPDACRLYVNQGPDADGRWTFRERADHARLTSVSAVVDGMGACFGDYDLDADLDLFVSAWHGIAGSNRLFANDGTGRFTDVTDAHLGDTRGIRGFTPRLADIDADGFPDLLLTNDFNTSRVYLNRGRTRQPGESWFVDVTPQTGVTADCNGMGSTLADFDGDTHLDWFMTNIYFPPPRDSCGNTLYRRTPTSPGDAPAFEDVARAAGVLDAGWGWGTTAADLDNDGDPDIAATSGWATYAQSGSTDTVFLNTPGLAFVELAGSAGFTSNEPGRALVHLDYDDDGDLDIVVAPGAGPLRLYHNEIDPAAGGWLRVRLDSTAHPCLPPGAFGTRARAQVRPDTPEQIRVVDGSYTYQGQSERTLHFGLGGRPGVARLEIRWTDGSTTVATNLDANQTITVAARHPADLHADGRLDYFDVSAWIALLRAHDPAADLDGDGIGSAADAGRLLAWIAEPCGP